MARWSRMFHGRPESVGDARRFTRLILAGHVLADLVELVVSELATNAIEHSASGEPGGFFVVELEIFRDHVIVAVVDMGSDALPSLAEDDPAQPVSLGGRGLHIVEAVAKDWGCQRVLVGLRVWADIAESA